MTPPAPSGAARAAAGRPAPPGSGRPARPEQAGHPERSRLAVLDRRDLRARARLRQARALLVLSGLVIAGALGVVAGAQGLVASQQLRLDQERQQLAGAVTKDQQLQLERAELESPARVLRIAEEQLHMVAPSKVTYLTPVSLGSSIEGTRKAPAR